MENKIQCKLHIFTRTIYASWETAPTQPAQLHSAFLPFHLTISHTWTSLKVALKPQNEHYIWHYEAFLAALPKASSFEKRSITRQCLTLGHTLRHKSQCICWFTCTFLTSFFGVSCTKVLDRCNALPTGEKTSRSRYTAASCIHSLMTHVMRHCLSMIRPVE